MELREPRHDTDNSAYEDENAMMPDYSTLRDDANFGWSAAGTQGALRELADVPIREFNLEPAACIEAYRRGVPLLAEMFGEDVRLPAPSTPAISYGHVNCLGSELLFPEGGEVGQTHIYDSLEQGIAALREPVDWGATGMAPFYLDFQRKMENAFPEQSVGLSFGGEGPITTAYELRGDGFFVDIFEAPDLAHEFLRLMTDSIVDFSRWRASLTGAEFPSPAGSGMCDDLSSFIPPRMFREFAVAYWDRYYRGMTTGRRTAHIEDLQGEQLPFLEEIGLWSYDPSVSAKLTPPIIAANCRVPFAWRLVSYHYTEMSAQDVEDFVFQACADGASSATTTIAATMCNPECVEQVHAFIAAGKECKRLAAEGYSRAEIGERVSPEGREKLWDKWCGYLGPESTRGGARASVTSEVE